MTRDEWMRLDWKLSDRELAEQTGVSRQRVHAMRHKLNRPPSRNGSKYKQFLAWASRVDLAKWTLHDVADRFGVSYTTASRWSKSVAPRRFKRKPIGSKIDWDGVDWSKPSATIADQLGVDQSTVHRHRQGRGEGPPATRLPTPITDRRYEFRQLPMLFTRHDYEHAFGLKRSTAKARLRRAFAAGHLRRHGIHYAVVDESETP